MASIYIEALNQQIRIDREVISRIRKEVGVGGVGQEHKTYRLLLGLFLNLKPSNSQRRRRLRC